MSNFCTIITADYFFYAKTISDCLSDYGVNSKFYVLVVNDNSEKLEYKNIEVISLNEISNVYPKDYKSIEKYEIDKGSSLRWALKPLFLKFIIEQKGAEKVIFLDPDLFFYNSPNFLFEYLNTEDIFITPHWRSIDPNIDSGNFDAIFSGGIYNAGIFGCSSKSIDILDWWLKVCAYKMEKENGFYEDQAYLNLMPLYFGDRVNVVQHKGCNVSNWNMHICKRTSDGEDIMINNKYPVVFIHFTNGTIKNILNGGDEFLETHLLKYKEALSKHNHDFEFVKTQKQSILSRVKGKLKHKNE